LTIARLRGVPAIVNYRGGQADDFLSHAPRFVHRQLSKAAARITPSVFLQRVFARHGLAADAIPNVVDLSRFPVQPFRQSLTAPHLLITRNLEAIYDIPTALRAFARVRQQWPHASMSVAGSGPELPALQALSAELGLANAVQFVGRVDNAQMASLYAKADLLLNASTVDNMPISILEALASGVPVVSTAAGGIPDLVEDGRTALLVPVGDHPALAAAALRLLGDRELAMQLREAGLQLASQFAWERVRMSWQKLYLQAVQDRALA
jgi:glycosyltransferase involved in cell wall biosynthesis